MMQRGLSTPLCKLLLAAAMFLLAGCSQELITGLSQRQANQTVALLQRYHLDAQKRETGKNRFAVYVEKAQFAEAVSLLDEFQVPSRDNLDIADLFPIDSLVNSPSAERARLISGVEQRLEQTVSLLGNILSARVHISYPLSGDASPVKPMRVSVVLIRDVAGDDTLLIQRIKALVKNSLDSIGYDDISVETFYKPTQTVAPSRPAAGAASLEAMIWEAGAAILLFAAAGVGGFRWYSRRSRAGSESSVS